MRTRVAMLREVPGPWIIDEVELDPPGPSEVLVEMVAAGLCHSDDHAATGDTPIGHTPMVGGHEGSGIVREVGPGVVGLEVGDHVITTFMPSCGSCRWCASGMQNLCDNGAMLMLGDQLDGTFRIHDDAGADVATLCALGTFAEWQVYDQRSLIKIDKDIPLDVACLVSCGVQTGFGAAAKVAQIQPGHVVVIVGVGGVGMNAVQGARESAAAHVIAIDPVEDKRKWALDFGATEAYESLAAASERIGHLTNGQGADSVILSAGLVTNHMFGEGYQAVRKAGTLVVTGLSNHAEAGVIPGLNANDLALMQKHIQGSLFGQQSPREATQLLFEMYRAGKLQLAELVTKVYTLDELNEATADLRAGRNIRGVIHFKPEETS